MSWPTTKFRRLMEIKEIIRTRSMRMSIFSHSGLALMRLLELGVGKMFRSGWKLLGTPIMVGSERLFCQHLRNTKRRGRREGSIMAQLDVLVVDIESQNIIQRLRGD